MEFRPLAAALRVGLLAGAVCLSACGDDDGGDTPAAGTGGGAGRAGSGGGAARAGSGGGAGRDAAVPEDAAQPDAPDDGFLTPADDGWLTLIEGDWELPPDSESYTCVRLTVPRDVYLSEFAPVIPLGTHHTVLTVVSEPTQPDGITPCSASTNGSRSIYGSGVGTQPHAMPEGVAVKLKAGEQLLLNLHLFNSGSETLRGRSGTLAKTIAEADVEHESGGVLAGPVQLEIPPGRVTQTGRCTLERDMIIFGVMPHMHQTGSYMKVVANSSDAGAVTLYDGPYDFEEQIQHDVDFVSMRAGDVVDVECTYENDTGRTINWGDSSLAEMCFAGLLHYPALQNTFTCFN
jgi:hypothetical protein